MVNFICKYRMKSLPYGVKDGYSIACMKKGATTYECNFTTLVTVFLKIQFLIY